MEPHEATKGSSRPNTAPQPAACSASAVARERDLGVKAARLPDGLTSRSSVNRCTRSCWHYCAVTPHSAADPWPGSSPAVLVHRPQLRAFLVHAAAAFIHVVGGQVHQRWAAAAGEGEAALDCTCMLAGAGGREGGSTATACQPRQQCPSALPAVPRSVALQRSQQLRGDVDGPCCSLPLALAGGWCRLGGAVDDAAEVRWQEQRQRVDSAA